AAAGHAVSRGGPQDRVRHLLEDRAGGGAVRRPVGARLPDVAGPVHRQRRDGVRLLPCHRDRRLRRRPARPCPPCARLLQEPRSPIMTPWTTERIGPAPHLSVDHMGTGELLVLLHGIGGNKRNWHDNLPALAAHRHTVAWDARGYGESDDYEGPLAFTD